MRRALLKALEMMLSLKWKLFILNTVCQGVFVMYTSLSLIIGLRITLPGLYKDDAETLFNRKILAVVFVLYTVGNYICMKWKAGHSVFSSSQQSTFVTDDIVSFNSNFNSNESCKGLSMKINGAGHVCGGDSILVNGRNLDHQLKASTSLSLAGWHKCRHCNELSPPRSKHCPICRACILKRDHHCFFAGCCIGFHNQRYFTIFCFYGTMGAFYSVFATYCYMEENHRLFQDWGLIAYFPPFLLGFWAMRYTSNVSVLFVLFVYWSFFTALLCLYFFLLQVFLVFRGQTKYELKQRTSPYRSHLGYNVMSVFGPSRLFCLVGFLIPSPFLGYFGDGKTWDELSSHAAKFA